MTHAEYVARCTAIQALTRGPVGVALRTLYRALDAPGVPLEAIALHVTEVGHDECELYLFGQKKRATIRRGPTPTAVALELLSELIDRAKLQRAECDAALATSTAALAGATGATP